MYLIKCKTSVEIPGRPSTEAPLVNDYSNSFLPCLIIAESISCHPHDRNIIIYKWVHVQILLVVQQQMEVWENKYFNEPIKWIWKSVKLNTITIKQVFLVACHPHDFGEHIISQTDTFQNVGLQLRFSLCLSQSTPSVYKTSHLRHVYTKTWLNCETSC